MFLLQQESATLQALMDRIIPADDYPSASGGGVMTYMTRLFDNDLQVLAEWFRSGLKSMELEALATFNGSFWQLAPDQQDDIMRRAISGSTAVIWSVVPSEFIRISINLVSEGYYANPENGGNIGATSWQMIGFTLAEGVRLPTISVENR